MATYIGEFASSRSRGQSPLGYQFLFTIGLFFTGLAGVWIVPRSMAMDVRDRRDTGGGGAADAAR